MEDDFIASLLIRNCPIKTITHTIYREEKPITITCRTQSALELMDFLDLKETAVISKDDDIEKTKFSEKTLFVYQLKTIADCWVLPNIDNIVLPSIVKRLTDPAITPRMQRINGVFTRKEIGMIFDKRFSVSFELQTDSENHPIIENIQTLKKK